MQTTRGNMWNISQMILGEAWNIVMSTHEWWISEDNSIIFQAIPKQKNNRG